MTRRGSKSRSRGKGRPSFRGLNVAILRRVLNMAERYIEANESDETAVLAWEHVHAWADRVSPREEGKTAAQPPHTWACPNCGSRHLSGGPGCTDGG